MSLETLNVDINLLQPLLQIQDPIQTGMEFENSCNIIFFKCYITESHSENLADFLSGEKNESAECGV